MQSGSSFLPAIAAFATLDDAAETPPAVTADRKAAQIALAAIDFKPPVIILSSQGLWARANVFDDRPPSLTLHAYDSEVLAASRGMRGQGAAYTPSRGKERGMPVEISEALLILLI